MPRKRPAILKVNWYDDSKGYYLACGVGGEDYKDFINLAHAFLDYLDLSDRALEPEPYRLFIGKRARRELGEKGVVIIEAMVKNYNKIVRAMRTLGDIVEEE